MKSREKEPTIAKTHRLNGAKDKVITAPEIGAIKDRASFDEKKAFALSECISLVFHRPHSQAVNFSLICGYDFKFKTFYLSYFISVGHCICG